MTFIRYFQILFTCILVPASLHGAVQPTARSVPPETNVDLVVRVMEDVVEEALAEIDFASVETGGTILIQSQTRHSANWLIDHILTDRLLARGYAVILDSTLAKPEDARLTYRILDLSLTGRSALGKSQVERRARIVLALSWIENGNLQWQDEFTRIATDWIPKNRTDLLANSSYNFAKLKLEEQNLGKFVEPVIVSTVLGSLVYLFFSSR